MTLLERLTIAVGCWTFTPPAALANSPNPYIRHYVNASGRVAVLRDKADESVRSVAIVEHGRPNQGPYTYVIRCMDVLTGESLWTASELDTGYEEFLVFPLRPSAPDTRADVLVVATEWKRRSDSQPLLPMPRQVRLIVLGGKDGKPRSSNVVALDAREGAMCEVDRWNGKRSILIGCPRMRDMSGAVAVVDPGTMQLTDLITCTPRGGSYGFALLASPIPSEVIVGSPYSRDGGTISVLNIETCTDAIIEPPSFDVRGTEAGYGFGLANGASGQVIAGGLALGSRSEGGITVIDVARRKIVSCTLDAEPGFPTMLGSTMTFATAARWSGIVVGDAYWSEPTPEESGNQQGAAFVLDQGDEQMRMLVKGHRDHYRCGRVVENLGDIDGDGFPEALVYNDPDPECGTRSCDIVRVPSGDLVRTIKPKR